MGFSIQDVISFFEHLSRTMPVELFVLVGTFIEEVVSPIPAFTVHVPAGAAAQIQGMPVWYIAVLALIASVGRAAGAWVIYFLADRLENVLLGQGRTFFGASHKDVEALGARLSGNPTRDWIMLFLMNAVPIFPGAFLSLACGFIKVRFDLFITATFAGSIISAAFFLSLGYLGISALTDLNNFERIGQIFGLLIIAGVVLWLAKKYRAKKK